MAGQAGREQASFASGELGDLLAERKNLKYYRSGLKRAENVVATAQGPAMLRPYTRLIGRRRRIMATVSLAPAVLAAPSGGNAALAADGSTASLLTSNEIGPGGPYVVFAATYPEPLDISAVDISTYRVSAGSGRIAVEYYSPAGVWTVLNEPRKLVTGWRSRRCCAPPQEPVRARLWRVVVSDLTHAASVDIGDVRFLAEGGTYGTARLRSFAFSREEAYDLVLMGGHGDVYAAEGGWLTGFALPHSASEARGRWRQRLNTGLLFAPTRPPWRIFRENSAYEWECSAAPLVNMPRHDYGDRDYTNGVTAVWRLTFINVSAFTLFSITVEGEETSAILIGTGSALETSVKAAIEDLEGIKPGITVSVTWSGEAGFVTITFSGEGNEGPFIINSARALNKADAAISWSRITRGRLGGEDIFSNSRGWPQTGIFYQQRLMMGGAPQVPNAVVASMTGDPFELNTDLSSANAPFIAPIDTDEDERIEEFLTARALMILTSRGEYWVANAAITKDQPLAPVKASQNGCAPGVPVVENEGAAIFADRLASVLCEFRYNEVDQTYTTSRLSLLASHLVSNVIDLALKRSDAVNDANILGLVQADGSMRLVTLLREQDVTAFSRVVTDGQFRAVSVNAANRMTVLVERISGGQSVQYVERFEDGLLLDQAVTRTLSPASATVSGLTDHDGRTVWAIASGNVYGPFTVSGGSITLPDPASEVTVGRWAPFLAETLPGSREIGPEIVTQSDVGYHTVRVSVSDTTSLAIGANGAPAEDVSMLDFGALADVPELNAPFTGLRERDGLLGSLPRPSITVTQKRPGRITLRSIVGEGDN